MFIFNCTRPCAGSTSSALFEAACRMTGRVFSVRTGGAGGGTAALSVGATDGTGDATGEGNTVVGPVVAAAEPDEAGVETTGDGAAVGGGGGGVALIVGVAVA